jgi:hypothetical protein
MPPYRTRDMRAMPAMARGPLYARDRSPANLIWYRAFEEKPPAPEPKCGEAEPCSET